MKCLSALILLFSLSAFAHEGGHGEVAESGKFGGITAPVIDKKQEGQGSKATTLYKAELVRSESGKLSLYLFDQKMNLMDLSKFGDQVEAKLEVKKKGKFTYFGTFKLQKEKNHFGGMLPKLEYRPFNIDMFFSHGEQKLFVGFSNLD